MSMFNCVQKQRSAPGNQVTIRGDTERTHGPISPVEQREKRLHGAVPVAHDPSHGALMRRHVFHGILQVVRQHGFRRTRHRCGPIMSESPPSGELRTGLGFGGEAQRGARELNEPERRARTVKGF